MANDAQRDEMIRARAGGLDILHRPELHPDLVVCAVDLHRGRDALGREACEKWGPGSSVSRIELEDGGVRFDLAVKWVRWRGLRGALADRCFGSRGARALAGAKRVAACGIGIPEVLAVADRRRVGWVVESFLITRFADGAQPLSALLPGLAGQPRSRRRLAGALGDLVGSLHAAGVDHPDLKHSNLLVGPGGRLTLLDLDALVPTRRLNRRRRVRSLALFEAYARDLNPWLPRSDRLRFLHAYFERCPEASGERRALLADVETAVDRKLANWARRDRAGQIHYQLVPRERTREGRVTRPGTT